MTKQRYPDIAQAKDMSGWSICGGDMVYDPHDAARAVFGEPEYDVRGEQFMYLFRRFGYPIHGWDDYKSLVSYYLTTPDAQVMLWCKPYSSPWLSFGYGAHPELYATAERAEQEWRRSEPRTIAWEQHPIYQRIDRAVRAAMNELLRPVPVRDMLYNITGRVPDDSPWARLKHAEYSPQAGYGLGLYDPVKACEAD